MVYRSKHPLPVKFSLNYTDSYRIILLYDDYSDDKTITL